MEAKTDRRKHPYYCFCILTLVSNTASSCCHRMVGAGRDLCGSSSPTSLPKQDHPEQAAQDVVQAGLEYLQRRRLHNLPGQPVPLLHDPQSEDLPHVQTELPLLQFVRPLPLALSLSTAILLHNLIDLTDELFKVTHPQQRSPAGSMELPSAVSDP